MAKFSVITDEKGNLLGAVRAEQFKTTDGKHLEFHPHPKYKHHTMEVDDKVLKGPASALGKILRAKAK
jgi:hypothetical protein